MNFTGHQAKTYNIEPQFIEQYSQNIFNSFDKDRSGSLEMGEFPLMINQLFAYLKETPPSQTDIQFMMNKHDADKNGKITIPEFKRMLYDLSGKPCPN